ncbi:AraC family transcriptional regulator [Dysgonomonas sp. 520]|nr:AraC family transcriptional regulator [Dysgonomonas sp. 520]
MMYCATLVYFTYCFTDSYRRFRVTMDNFYSEDLAARLRWIAIVFYAALVVGVFALVTAQYFNFVLGTAFALTSLCFYTFFGIQILNYQWQFEIIETPQNDENTESPAKINTGLLRRWIDEKQLMEQGITINNVAHYIGTNRHYLSEYINANKNMTFRQWINSLRLAEAKKLIRENPEMTLNEIAEQSGYSNARNLIRQFYQQTGGSPTVGKEKNLNS